MRLNHCWTSQVRLNRMFLQRDAGRVSPKTCFANKVTSSFWVRQRDACLVGQVFDRWLNSIELSWLNWQMFLGRCAWIFIIFKSLKAVRSMNTWQVNKVYFLSRNSTLKYIEFQNIWQRSSKTCLIIYYRYLHKLLLWGVAILRILIISVLQLCFRFCNTTYPPRHRLKTHDIRGQGI